MSNIIDFIWGAFQRIFFDISGGNFSDIDPTDIGVVAMVIVVPIFTIAAFLGTQKS